MMMKNLPSKLHNAVLEGDISAVEVATKDAVEAGYDPLKVTEWLSSGIREVGERFSKLELFVPDLILSAEAMKAGMRILLPAIERRGGKIEYKGRVILGTVAGDIHDIGKSLVAVMLETRGFEVIDLGADVPTKTFVEKVKELKPDILGLSALLTTTMLEQRKVIEALQKEGLRDKVKVMVGGAVASEEWTKEIEADAYGIDAVDAAEKAEKLLSGVTKNPRKLKQHTRKTSPKYGRCRYVL